MNAQISMHDEIVIDNFAGGGGASVGIELAIGRPIAYAINHDPDAIRIHKTNHPYSEHLQTSVWDVDPEEVCAGRPVGLAWFSPDCTHFSKARGGKPVDKNIRSLSWVVVKWALSVRPRVMMMENVEEIKTWGPVKKTKIKGKTVWIPDPEHAGETFDAFIGVLTTGIPQNHPAIKEICKYLQLKRSSPEIKRLIKGLGYKVEYRELVAADYGAPTTRKRFVLIARCDDQPIRWPERTHAPRDSEEVKNGKCKPWRSAAEIIDWTQPMYSIFATRAEIKAKYGVKVVRPLADNTLRRIIRGVDKFTIKSSKPFIVECNHSGSGHLSGIEKPIGTITQKCTMGTCVPLMEPFTFSNTGGSVGSPASEPVHTISTAGGQVLAAANLIQYHTELTENVRANDLHEALPTVDASNRYGLTVAHLTEYYGNGQPITIAEPLHTVTSHDREALTAVHIQKYFGGVIGADAADPLPTVTAIDHNALTAAHIVEFKGQDIGQRPDRPLRTITAGGGEFAVASVRIEKYDPNAPFVGRWIGHWPEIRTLLNKHCGYNLEDDEILLLNIGGTWFFINDITMRMLTPRELYAAMGFPPDYIIDVDYTGKPYPKSLQVARCGNAVSPPMASAVVRANFPEWSVEIVTMAQFARMVAV